MEILRRWIASVALAVAGMSLINIAFAQEAPDALIRRVSAEVLETARTDPEIQGGNRQRIMQLVESKILPHADFQRTTALVAGRYWRQASAEQRQRLTEEFRTLLMYTYAGALSQVRDQQMVIKPLRAAPEEDEVVVHSEFRQARGAEPVQVSYRLLKSAAGWKIYDVNVMGVWLIEAYKNNFSQEISQHGIDGLIRTLSERNKKLATSALIMPGRAAKTS